jgi:DNA-binding transcriptional LysR family regulator
VADYICGSRMILVGSPDLLGGRAPVRSAEDLLQFPLLEHTDIPLAWAQAFDDLKIKPGVEINLVPWDYYSVIIRSACAGLGLALLPRCFITQELARGELVQVFNYSQESPSGYYFLFSSTRQDDPALNRLRDWLQSRRGSGEEPQSVR